MIPSMDPLCEHGGTLLTPPLKPSEQGPLENSFLSTSLAYLHLVNHKSHLVPTVKILFAAEQDNRLFKRSLDAISYRAESKGFVVAQILKLIRQQLRFFSQRVVNAPLCQVAHSPHHVAPNVLFGTVDRCDVKHCRGNHDLVVVGD